MTVDLSPFARRFLVPAHGEVLVNVSPAAPQLRKGTLVSLTGLTASTLMVKRILACDVQGTTLLLGSVVLAIQTKPRPRLLPLPTVRAS